MRSRRFNVPVILLVFNRPELTARLLARVREVQPQQVIIVADGPRKDRDGDVLACRKVRELCDHGVDWPCEVDRDYAVENLGCAERISSGITRAFTRLECAIILEDDCIPEVSFFGFAAELLARFEHDTRVGHIAGCSFRQTAPPAGESYYFSRYPLCWGWATWRRAWAKYDHGMSAWPQARDEFLGALNTRAERNYWENAFGGTKAGRIDSWAYRWTLSCWANHLLAAVSSTNLVSNVGFGEGATHTRQRSGLAEMPTRAVGFPLQHPAQISRDEAADEATGRWCFQRPGLATRALRRIGIG